jgi:hypothetical protein
MSHVRKEPRPQFFVRNKPLVRNKPVRKKPVRKKPKRRFGSAWPKTRRFIIKSFTSITTQGKEISLKLALNWGLKS